MIRILVVEDNSNLRDHLGELLESQGYAVETADTSEEAQELLAAAGADLMIIDIFLPGKDGLQLLLEIRCSHPQVKIIITSGKEHLLYGKSLKLALSLGAHQTLSKPFTTEHLMQCVRNALN